MAGENSLFAFTGDKAFIHQASPRVLNTKSDAKKDLEIRLLSAIGSFSEMMAQKFLAPVLATKVSRSLELIKAALGQVLKLVPTQIPQDLALIRLFLSSFTQEHAAICDSIHKRLVQHLTTLSDTVMKSYSDDEKNLLVGRINKVKDEIAALFKQQ
eukprot:TRINITY_DN3847_c0_g1_i1.p1 TRINITY_DN3847_c0_g1~~TRINITY_DN3847_c0_g1_i1.p1  ORF type:complete len:180 (+),score=32.38 TRINITY_DN3847_c0_g1_i1:74-541(+)